MSKEQYPRIETKTLPFGAIVAWLVDLDDDQVYAIGPCGVGDTEAEAIKDLKACNPAANELTSP